MSEPAPNNFRLRFALERIHFVRAYTLPLLKDIKPDDWFRTPQPGLSHLAWQMGHMAVAQYHMALYCVRDTQPVDAELLPAAYRPLFGRGSIVESDPSKYPQPDELRSVFDRIHQQIPLDLNDLPEAELDQPSIKPHPAFQTKFAALVFAAEHEMVHAGQIGLLRRLIGYPSIR
jgi:hypothetical protein